MSILNRKKVTDLNDFELELWNCEIDRKVLHDTWKLSRSFTKPENQEWQKAIYAHDVEMLTLRIEVLKTAVQIETMNRNNQPFWKKIF